MIIILFMLCGVCVRPKLILNIKNDNILVYTIFNIMQITRNVNVGFIVVSRFCDQCEFI